MDAVEETVEGVFAAGDECDDVHCVERSTVTGGYSVASPLLSPCVCVVG